MKTPVYMDNHATTPLDPRVLDAMLPYFTEAFGNAASSTHVFGWRALEAVEKARSQVARLVGAEPKDIIFTSGATESINLAIKGAVAGTRGEMNHVIACVTEHKAVLDVCDQIEAGGGSVTLLPVDSDGMLDLGSLEAAITPQTALISIMHGNNEIGVLHPIRAIGEIATRRGVPLHVDAAQTFGKVPIDVTADGISLLSISAHKIYGPKGVGALYVRRRNPTVRLEAQMHGGGHERGLRSGTLNVPGIVGLGAAAELASREMAEEALGMAELRDRLLMHLRRELQGIHVNGSMEHRLPGNLNVSFDDVEGESLVMGMRDVAVSSGSACTSASASPSYVLRALGVSDTLAHSSIRFGLGRFNTQEEVDYVADRVVETVQKLRALADGLQ